MSTRYRLLCAVAGLLFIAVICARIASIFTVAFNWDEFALFNRVAQAIDDGILRASGHAGLTEIVLTPLVEGCQDEIAVGRAARGLWQILTLAYLAGIGILLAELLRGWPHRIHDAALGTALLGALPVFLEWSLQVRSDHIALVGGLWGGVALLVSRRHLFAAPISGLCFGLGWVASQKAAYVAALMVLLALAQLVIVREWRPRREIIRGLLVGGMAAALVYGFDQYVAATFELLVGQPKGLLPEASQVTRHLDVFNFYRNTIGYGQYAELVPTLIPHAVLFALLVAASIAAARRRLSADRIFLAWAVLALGVVVGGFHAGAFGYFWMTLGLFPAVALAIALGPIRELVVARNPSRMRAASVLVWIALALPATLALASLLRDTQFVQRESLGFVHRNFSSGQAGFHPESALFCESDQPIGTWMSFTIYEQFGGAGREANSRRMIERFRETPVYYLVESFRLNQFPVELRRFWADNYQPYRASVFVAGRRLEGIRGDTAHFEIIIPGNYRWIPHTGPQAIRIGERTLMPGDVLSLSQGEHTASFPEDVPGGMLVLAVDDPPAPAPLAFYKPY